MVDIIGSIKSAWDLAIHPSKAKPMSIGDALKFYYSFALIPAILYAIILAITGSMSSFGVLAGVLQGIFAFVLLLIAYPIGMFFGAGLYHTFGKVLFRKFQNNYNATFTAVMISIIPAILFLWVGALISEIVSIAIGTGAAPLAVGVTGLYILISIILGIWGLILLTIALMKLQKVSGVIAVLSWLLPEIVLFIFVFLLIFALLGLSRALSPAVLTTI